MTTKKPSGAPEWSDPDDAPELDAAFFERAEIRHGDRVIRRGRPTLAHPKEAVTLRLDQDILAAFRAEGPGWQTRINATLRAAIKKAG